MTNITQNQNGQDVIECSFPCKEYAKAQTKRERNLVCLRASEEAPKPTEQESVQRRKEMFNAMTPREQVEFLGGKSNLEKTLDSIGFKIELQDPMDRRTPLLRNGRPVR